VRQVVHAVDVHLVRLAQFGGHVSRAGGGGQRDEQVLVRLDAVGHLPALTLAGQRSSIGTRTPPSQVVAFSPRKGVVAPSGHQDAMRAVVGWNR
jgi:hypothetical protein